MITANAWTDHLRDKVGYTVEEAGEDEFFAYISELEEIVDALDEALARNAAGAFSAADVCAVGFHVGLGDCVTD